MKRVFIACLIVLLIALALVLAIEYDPGYLLISYGHYTLESSVWVGIAVLLGIFFLIYLCAYIIRRLFAGGNAVGSWLSGRDLRRNQLLTTRGIIAFIEGNWQHSQRLLNKAAAKSDTPLLNYLIAARASDALGNEKETREFFKKAELSTSGAGIAVGLTQAELQLRNGQLEQCLATLTRVRRNAGKHPHVLDLLVKVYQRLSDWQEILKLMPELKKFKVLPADKLAALEIAAAKGSLDEASKSRDDVVVELEKQWSSLPKLVTKNSDVVAVYAGHLMANANMQKAEKIIRKQLKKDWNKTLVSLYGKVSTDDVGKQLLYAVNWLKERNNDAVLLLCLGRLSLQNEQWANAREYFENSMKLETNSEVCAELGRLLAHLGEHEKSNEYFQQGLKMLQNGLADLPMPADKP